MSDPKRNAAFGAPGIEPRWTPSTKEGIGTAYHTGCRVWFTLSHGIVDELYYPNVDSPNTRDFQLLITDGESFCHEERRDLFHEIEYPEKNVPLYRLTNSEPNGRYRIVKDILTDPRFGVRDPLDPLIADSVVVIDRVLKHNLPQGPCWRRYNRDGYGQKDDGAAYDGTGTGRCWPLLTGERGHYELACGHDPMPFIRALENFANVGGMLPEQVWDADDLPDMHMKRGSPAGSAMPLCWAHAEYIKLVRSHRDNVCVDRITPVYDRYVRNRTKSRVEIWTFAHQTARMPMGKTLRIITGAAVTIRWSCNAWVTMTETEARETSLSCRFADLPTSDLEEGAALLFTFRWGAKWEGKDYCVRIENRASLS
jgi:hypothetical protein